MAFLRFLRRPITILIILQVALVVAFLARSDKRLSDFPAFYAAARLYQKSAQPFDLENQCAEQKPFRRSECLPYVHPPVLMPLLSLVVTDNYVASYWRWVAVLLVVLLACLFPLYRLTQDLPASAQVLLWQPMLASVWIGQDTAFIFAAIAFWIWLLLDGREFLSGIILSLTVIKPHFAIALAVPLLFANRRAFAGFTIGAAALTLFSLALIGVSGFRGITQMTSIMGQAKGFGVWPEGMSNLAGILYRAGLSTLWAWPVFVMGIASITVLWSKRGVTLQTVSLALVVLCFTAPHVHPWDVAPLALPLALFGVMPLLISSLLLFILWPDRLLHVGCYVVMTWLTVVLFQRMKHHKSTFRSQSRGFPFLNLF